MCVEGGGLASLTLLLGVPASALCWPLALLCLPFLSVLFTNQSSRLGQSPSVSVVSPAMGLEEAEELGDR